MPVIPNNITALRPVFYLPETPTSSAPQSPQPAAHITVAQHPRLTRSKSPSPLRDLNDLRSYSLSTAGQDPEKNKELVLLMPPPRSPQGLYHHLLDCKTVLESKTAHFMDTHARPRKGELQWLTPFSARMKKAIQHWQQGSENLLIRARMDEVMDQVATLKLQLERMQVAGQKGNPHIMGAVHALTTLQQSWRQARYQQAATHTQINSWLSQTSSLLHKSHASALTKNPLKPGFEWKPSPSALKELIDLKTQLAECLTLGGEVSEQKLGSLHLQTLEKRLKQQGIQIRLTSEPPQSFEELADNHAYQNLVFLLSAAQETLNLPSSLRGNAQSLIERGEKAIAELKQPKPHSFLNRVRTLAGKPIQSSQSVHRKRLLREIREDNLNTQTADLIKEKAKMGRGVQRTQERPALESAQDWEAGQWSASLAPDALGFTEAIAGLRSCIHKSKKTLSSIRQISKDKDIREQARHDLQAFCKKPLNEQIQNLPSFYAGLKQTEKGKLKGAGLYNLAVEASDAFLGSVRYSTNIAVNGTRIGNTLLSAASHTGPALSVAEGIATAATASSALAMGLSTAKASKAGLALKRQINTLEAYKAKRDSSQQSHSETLLNYAIDKQHKIFPKAVDLVKESLSASAYAVSTGVGIASIATTGTAVGLTVATGVGAGAAATAAATSLGAVAYHQGRLWAKNKHATQLAMNFVKDAQHSEKLTSELLKRLPNIVAEQLVFDLKRDISADRLSDARGDYLALFERLSSATNTITDTQSMKSFIQQWVNAIRSKDIQFEAILKESAAAQCLLKIGMEPSVVLGIALSSDNEQQDELSRQLILKAAGIPIIKGMPLNSETLKRIDKTLSDIA